MPFTVFTANEYPAFVHNEIKWLRKFDGDSRTVTSISNPEKSAYQNTFAFPQEFSRIAIVKNTIKWGRTLFKILVKDLNSAGTSRAYRAKWREYFSLLVRSSIQADELQMKGFFNVNGPYYCYFLNEYALTLSFAVLRGYIPSFSCRAHGRDVIESREPITQKLCFQWFKYQQADSVYCVSRATQNYVQKKYPEYQSKIDVSFLGTDDYGFGPVDFPEMKYTIVSVGGVVNVKRIYLIAEMLALTKLNIEWFHFGHFTRQDETQPRFKRAIQFLENQKENITVKLIGQVANAEIISHYKNTPVDLLINTSEDEGLPVAIMEATSFGIPCLATDVGGTSEIVNEITGMLLPVDFKIEAAASMMEKLLLEKCRNIESRRKIRAYWENNFQASQNYFNFFGKLGSQ